MRRSTALLCTMLFVVALAVAIPTNNVPTIQAKTNATSLDNGMAMAQMNVVTNSGPTMNPAVVQTNAYPDGANVGNDAIMMASEIFSTARHAVGVQGGFGASQTELVASGSATASLLDVSGCQPQG